MGHWGWHHRRYQRGGFMWIGPMILLFFVMFGVFRFFWPLLLVGFLILLAKGAFRSQRWDGGDWGGKFKNDDKRKNDEYDKPKRDDGDNRRYVQTDDGEWLEII